MAVTEASRYRLHQRLEEVLGPEQATTLMEHLPPVGWADVATKHDLAQLEERMGYRMDTLRAELRGEMAELRGEMGELRGEMNGLRAEVRGEIGGLRAELHSELRKYAFAVLAANVPLVGLAFAAARLT
ncbi:MAG TPA: hypothetical protein VGB14_11990 [Acidimicrobiales bacterium]